MDSLIRFTHNAEQTSIESPVLRLNNSQLCTHSLQVLVCQFELHLRVTKNAAFSLLTSLRKKKANKWDYLIAGERKKEIWGIGTHVAIFVIFLAKFFLQSMKFATPSI